MKVDKSNMLWFLVGLGSQMQIVASLSFTELFALIAGPYLFLKNSYYLKRDGIMPFLVLALCVFFGCAVACLANHTPGLFVLRGFAVTTIIPCAIVTAHGMMRKNPNGFKWYFLGGAISMVLCTFIFQKSVEVSQWGGGAAGDAVTAGIMAGPLFWVSRLGGFVMLLTNGWYLHTPILWDVPAALFMSGFALLTTESGRSAALGSLAFVTILLIGGKSMRTMRRRLCAHFGLICLLGVGCIFLAKAGYSVAAERGWLGEKAYKKYEMQTRGDKSLKKLLLGGRMESFCGLIACADKPIVGFGPWAQDKWGYVEEFLAKYGDPEDLKRLLSRRRTGDYTDSLIPCHAYITSFWLWYGIFGLVFWLYVLFVFMRYLKQDCWAVPQWFAWLACGIPGYCWQIFFSPLNNRFSPILFVVACLMARAVRKGTFVLPRDMQEEIIENERKRA